MPPNTIGQPERATQNRVIALFRDELDYRYLGDWTDSPNIRPDTSDERKRDLLAEWYREKLKEVVPAMIAKWEPLIGVRVEKTFFQRMKTKWGSCNHRTKNIRLNTELAKKPPECLEYVVVHEMAHLLEPSHNSRFITLMDQFMPSWRNHREELNRSPLGHEEWEY